MQVLHLRTKWPKKPLRQHQVIYSSLVVCGIYWQVNISGMSCPIKRSISRCYTPYTSPTVHMNNSLWELTGFFQRQIPLWEINTVYGRYFNARDAIHLHNLFMYTASHLRRNFCIYVLVSLSNPLKKQGLQALSREPCTSLQFGFRWRKVVKEVLIMAKQNCTPVIIS